MISLYFAAKTSNNSSAVGTHRHLRIAEQTLDISPSLQFSTPLQNLKLRINIDNFSIFEKLISQEMNIYTPSPPAPAPSSAPKLQKKKPRVALFQTMVWDGDNAKAPAGREMTYELPPSPVSSTTCSSFSEDIFATNSRETSLSSDVFIPEQPMPTPESMTESTHQGQGREITLELPFSSVSSQRTHSADTDSEIEIHGYRARPIIPPSLNDLDLPAHPFNVFLPIPTNETAENRPKTKNFPTTSNLSLVDISPMSSPGNNGQKEDLNTSWISDGSFISYDSNEPLPSSPPPPRRIKENSLSG